MKNFKLIEILNKVIFYLYLSLFFFTPLIMSSLTSELFEFNKIIFIYFIAILIFFLWLAKIILIKKIILKKTLLDIPIFVFLLSQFFSTIFSIDFHTSFFGYYGRFNGGFLSIITYIILFYGFISNIDEKQIVNRIYTLLKTSIISSIIVIFWGLPGRFGCDLSCLLFTGQWNNFCWSDQFRPAERIFSTLGQPNWLGAYLVINFFIGLFFFLQQKRISKNWIWFFYLIFNFTSIIFTRSRSAFIAIVFGLFILILYLFFFSKQQFLKRKLLILLLIFVLPVLVFKTGIEKIDKYLNFWQLVSPQKINHKNLQSQNLSPSKINVTESFDIRKIVWKGAIDLGLRYPLFGTGVETFAYSYYFIRPKQHNLTSEWDYLYNKAHNEYLNYFATTGFFGLITYLLMIFFVFYLFMVNFFRLYRQKLIIELKNQNIKEKKFNNAIDFGLINLCLIIAYLSILITNFFGFSTTTINLFFYLFPAFFVIEKIYENDKKEKKIKLDERLNLIQKFAILILTIFTVYLLIFVFKYWFADYYYAKSDFSLKTNQYSLAAFYLKEKALKLKYEHVYEDKLSYVLANLAFLSYHQKEKKYASSLKNLSIFYNNHSLYQSPKNVLYWKTKAKIYYLFFQMELDRKNIEIAIKALEEAEKLAPTDPKIPYTLAFFQSILYQQIKDEQRKINYIERSLKSIDHAIDLKTDMIEAYLLKGQLLKKYEKTTEAKKVYQYIIDNLDSQNKEAKKELNFN